MRVEQVKLAFQTVERVIALRARRHLAILVVAVAGLVSTLAAGFTGQLDLGVAWALVVALGSIGGIQLVALDRVEREMKRAGETANRALERLIVGGGEQDADAPEVHSRGGPGDSAHRR